MLDNDLLEGEFAELLTGRLAEYGELLDVLAQRPGLTVISADPWSGTSPLLGTAINELDGVFVFVDARSCADSLDLAMAIADTSVIQLAPRASAWWMGTAPPASTAGLEFARTLSELGVDLDDLRLGSGLGKRRLSEAIELMLTLANREAVLVIDHLGLMLSALPRMEARQLLGDLRAARQKHPDMDLVLVEHADGAAAAALADRGHPLYRAGLLLRFRRPQPNRFVEDLAITRPSTDAPAELIGAAAELAGGVPFLTWRVIENAPSEGEDEHTRALAGWRRLRRMTSAQTAREWDLLRHVHPVAQSVVAAISVGVRPHTVAANSKSVNAALHRLRGLGMTWQPEPRRWALADPLLAAWVGEYAPPWAAHRRAAAFS